MHAWSAPGAAEALRDLLAAHPRRFSTLAPVLLRERPPGTFDALLGAAFALQHGGYNEAADQHLIQAAVLSTPDDAASTARSMELVLVSAGRASPWVHALGEVHRCADAACLHRVLLQGTDEDAARAVVLAGGATLASLPLDVSAALVRRAVFQSYSHNPTSLLLATLATVRGCPPNLRGLQSVGRGYGDHGDALEVLQRDFARSCVAARGAAAP
jgi:hypothetical protein